MPSQRSKTKKMLGGYYHFRLYNVVSRIAKREEKTIRDLVGDMICEGVERRGEKVVITE